MDWSHDPGNSPTSTEVLGSLSSGRKSEVLLVPAGGRSYSAKKPTRSGVPLTAEEAIPPGQGTLATELRGASCRSRRECGSEGSSFDDGLSSTPSWSDRDRRRGTSFRRRRGRQKEKEKEKAHWKTEGQSDGGEGQMEQRRYTLGSGLQKAREAKNSQEEKQLLDERRGFRGRVVLRGWSGDRESFKDHQQKIARVSLQSFRQRSKKDACGSGGGKSSDLQGLQSVLQTDGDAERRIKGYAERDANPKCSPGHLDGRQRLGVIGHHGPKIEGSGNDATRFRPKSSIPDGAVAPRTRRPGSRQGGQLCPEEISCGKQIEPTIEIQSFSSKQTSLEPSSQVPPKRGQEGFGQRQSKRQNSRQRGRRQQGDHSPNRQDVELVHSSSEERFQAGVRNQTTKIGPGGTEAHFLSTGSGARSPIVGPKVDAYPVEAQVRQGVQSHGMATFGDATAADSEPRPNFSARVSSLGRLAEQVFDQLPRILKDFGAKRGPAMEGIFPLPLPHDFQNHVCELFKTWEEGVIRSINWMVVGSFSLGDASASPKQSRLLDEIRRSLVLLKTWNEVEFENFDPQDMFRQRWINSYGEEVHVAQSVRWENVCESLPKEEVAGVVPSWEICQGGFRDFLLNPEKWLKPPNCRVWAKPPKVQVPQDAWREVAQGLIDRNICGIMPLADAFKVDGQPILGGIFGVPKNESTESGIPILRLIMDLRPINENFLPLGGDLSTLPVLSQMFQLQLQPGEGLIVSSEDIRAMFYIIGLPPVWGKFLCFSKPIPEEMRPEGSTGEYVLYSKVLPMGYVNSVSLAQHLHRQIIIKAFGGILSSQQEVRRDREFPHAKLWYRTYLDNFDLLSIRSKGILESEHSSLLNMLKEVYSELGVPRNVKKAVESSPAAEMQGAWIDGERGICSPKVDKVGKYLSCLVHVLHTRRVTQKQMQMLVGGLVYMFSFKRPLMSILNDVWKFILTFSNDKQLKPLPAPVLAELWASFFMSVFSYMDFRLETDPTVTASDASETGGGLVASQGLTDWGVRVSQGSVRGEKFEEFREKGLLVISLFDGVGSLRIALDSLRVNLAGYISVEQNQDAQRVLESHFPSSKCFPDVTKLTKENIYEIAAAFPNCCGVLLGGGPPCQGVSKLNASRKGAVADPRSCLHQVFDQIKEWIKEVFTWCPNFFLMESVASMNDTDRATYTLSSGVLPYKVDAFYLAPCRRPRLWWFNWVVENKEGTEIFPPMSCSPTDYGEIRFHFDYKDKQFLRPGWTKAGQKKFLTFTTAQPSKKPRYRPAGIEKSSQRDLEVWEQDRHRFPPYAYDYENGVCHKRKGWRMLDINEKEIMMGMPLNYTEQCKAKAFRTGHPLETDDIRMSLVGNAWHVGVVANLLQPLCESLGLSEKRTVSQVMNALQPGGSAEVAGLLLRPGFERPQPFARVEHTAEEDSTLVSKLCHLVSSKGTDVLLTSNSEGLPKQHRLRNSLSPKLWKWRVLCGWKWRGNSSSIPEHINKLEMRAVETGLRWRLFRHKAYRKRVLHLVDSMVSLQIINKGRTSSRKLRSISRRIAALLISGNLLLTLAYTATKTNPADAPSRRGRKRKWGDVK